MEFRKLEYDCPPTPKPREEGQPVQIVLGRYYSFSLNSHRDYAAGGRAEGLAAKESSRTMSSATRRRECWLRKTLGAALEKTGVICNMVYNSRL